MSLCLLFECRFHFFPPKSVSSCEIIEVEMCQGLSYNLTSFPNIWLPIPDQRKAATLLRQYRVSVALTDLHIKHSAPVSEQWSHLVLWPGADGAGVLQASAEAGVWDVSSWVQPSGGRPAALPISLLLCWAAVQPGPGPLLLQLALQLPPAAGLAGPPGVLTALMF